MNISFSRTDNLPEDLVPGRVYFTQDGVHIAISESESEQYVSNNVLKFISQMLTDEQKAQARENIGAASKDDGRIFIGTQEEYTIAHANNKIAKGALVIILDDNETENSVVALLGTAVLGKMILGNN